LPVLRAGLLGQTLDRLRGEAIALSPDWGPKVSLFWTDRTFSCGRFPLLDRIDYLDYAVVLTERERMRPARPTVEKIRSYLSGAPFAAWEERARGFAAAEALAAKDRKAHLRALLYPSRFCYSWLTGRMGSNEQAVAYLRENPVGWLDVGLIERALRYRRSAADPDALFPERVALLAQVDACAALLAARA
jgi:hypothetical protein